MAGLLVLSLSGSTDPVINIGGLPIPDAGPVFLAVLAVHVLAASVCVVAGAAATTARKRPGRHPRSGTVYVCGLLVVVVSAGVLAVMRWHQDRQLFFIAAAAAGFGFTGWWARRRRPRRWLLWHGGGMAGSYIVLLTGFYVDNGPHLPFWDRLPPVLLWLLPTAIGVPVTVWALIRNNAADRVNLPRGAARSAAPRRPPRRAGPS